MSDSYLAAFDIDVGELFPGADEAACKDWAEVVFFPDLQKVRRALAVEYSMNLNQVTHEMVDEKAYELGKRICGNCPVMESCREYALKAKEPHGLWGGMTENERKNYGQGS